MTSNELLFLLFSICQLCCILIPIIDKKQINGERKRYNFGDYALITLAIVGFAFSFFIFLSTQDEEKNKAILESNYQIELSRRLAERDSIHQYRDSILTVYYGNKVDSSYSKSILASNEALAKYNLILIDSMNKVASKVNIKSINLPQLTIEASTAQGSPIYVSEVNNEPVLNIKLKSLNNISYNLHITLCILNIRSLISDSLFTWNIVGCEPFEDRSFLPTDIIETSEVKFKKEWLKLENAIILFQGEYSADIDNKSKRKYSQAYEFNFVTKKLGYQVVGKSLEEIITKLKERKLL